jgi:hypothetical protein
MDSVFWFIGNHGSFYGLHCKDPIAKRVWVVAHEIDRNHERLPISTDITNPCSFYLNRVGRVLRGEDYGL